GWGFLRWCFGGVFVVAVGDDEVGGRRSEVGGAVAGGALAVVFVEPPPQPARTAAIRTVLATAFIWRFNTVFLVKDRGSESITGG
ncbi:MAG TPA: hypothetical protein VJU60_00935, partial [Thermoleophilaceae bacterium]|nr:hypothetical protein [Thermoleophilaceae bacterium]